MLTAATSLLLFCLISTVRAQQSIDVYEGKKVVAASESMQAEADKIIAAKDIDRAWLMDDAHLLTRDGYHYIETSETMFTLKAKGYMRDIGEKFLQASRTLLDMGRQKGALTQKEKEELKKQAAVLNDFGKLMIEKGQILTGSR